MHLSLFDSPAMLEEATQQVFQTSSSGRTTAFFLAVFQVVDLYRFRHEGPVEARREEALDLLLGQIARVRHSTQHHFTEDDDLARRALMFSHKADLQALATTQEEPQLHLEGFGTEEDGKTATLNRHLSYTRRQYLFDGLVKAAQYIRADDE